MILFRVVECVMLETVTDQAIQAKKPTQGKKGAPGVRARVRAELTAEIKAAARRQLATEGASSLSLRAIARELDMASSAIYRYFASREDLLTALIIDAYESVGEVAEQADAAHARDDHQGRLISIGTAIRTWAQANPHEYALIYGSPVPGYAAPEDTIDPAIRVPVVLMGVLVDRYGSGTGDARTGEPAGGDLADALAELSVFVEHTIEPDTLARGVEAWAEIFGLVSLELFGHFHNAVTDSAAFFAHAMQALAERTLA